MQLRVFVPSWVGAIIVSGVAMLAAMFISLTVPLRRLA